MRKSGAHLSYHMKTHVGLGLRLEYFIWREMNLLFFKQVLLKNLSKKWEIKMRKKTSQQLGMFLSLFSSGWMLQSLSVFQKYHSQIPQARYVFWGNHLPLYQRCTIPYLPSGKIKQVSQFSTLFLQIILELWSLRKDLSICTLKFSLL